MLQCFSKIPTENWLSMKNFKWKKQWLALKGLKTYFIMFSISLFWGTSETSTKIKRQQNEINLLYFFLLATFLFSPMPLFFQAQAGWTQHDVGHLSVFSTSKLNHAIHYFLMSFTKVSDAGNRQWWRLHCNSSTFSCVASTLIYYILV